jgi:acetyl esterase/lipase
MKLTSLHKAFLQKILVLQFLIFSALLFSQRQKTTLLFEKANVQENIIYKTDESGREILLDLYTPQKTGINTISKLLDKNFAIISINYRLVSKNIHFPAPIEDTKDAVRWIRKNADKYQLDPDNIGMWGVSAGAHLSLLSAYTEDTQFPGDPILSPYSAKVNYVVDNFGPTDMNRLLHTRAPQPLLFAVGLISQKIIDLRSKLIMGITGMNAKENRKEIAEFCENISPLSYNKNTVPTLIIHGNEDKIAPVRHSKRLHKMLKKTDTENKLIIIKKGNHGFSTTDKAELEEISNLMVNFIIDQQKK